MFLLHCRDMQDVNVYSGYIGGTRISSCLCACPYRPGIPLGAPGVHLCPAGGFPTLGNKRLLLEVHFATDHPPNVVYYGLYFE